MKMTIIAAFAAAALATSAAVASGTPPAGTAMIDLPGDLTFAFKPGPGVETARQYCLSCHSSAYVSTQRVLSAAQWTAEVNKMKNVYKAPIPDDQVPAITAYLTAQYGKP